MDRGKYTEELHNKYGISPEELRLIPYLQYLLVNHMPVDPNKISGEERRILSKWRDEGHITFSMTDPCTSTKKFWDFISEILYETYVIHKGD